MRQALLDDYNRQEAHSATSLMLREAIDMSVEEPDHARWHLYGGVSKMGDPTVGGGMLAKDLVETSAAEVRKQAFILFYSSPFARGIIRTLRKFIFGKGVKIELTEQRQGKKKQAEEYLDEWQDVNKWDIIQKETSDRTFRDGETFWHNRWMGSKKIPRLEVVEPDDVRSDKDGAEHGIEMDPKDPTTVKRYHIRKLVNDARDPQSMFIQGEDMEHLKINVDSNMKRGRSLFEPVFRYFTWHEDWLKSRIVLNKVRSAVALVRHVEGTQVQGQLIRRATEIKNTPEDRRNRATSTMFRSGSILTAGPGVKYEMLSANLGASDAAQDGRNILLSIAVGVGFPEMFLTGNFENNNYSSSQTAQNPFVREFEDWQDFFDFHIRREIKRVLELGIKARLVAKDTELKCTVEFPPLVYEDFVQMSTALGQLFLNEIISAHTYAAKLGFDYDEEKEKRDEEQAELGSDENNLGGGAPGEEPPPQEDTGAQDQEFLQSKEYDDRDHLIPNRRLLRGLKEGEEEIQEKEEKDLLKRLQYHQDRNAAKQKHLAARIAAGSSHTKTMAMKKGKHERRQARIDKLLAKINNDGKSIIKAAAKKKSDAYEPSKGGAEPVDVKQYTKHSKTGKTFIVHAHTRKGRTKKDLAEGKIIGTPERLKGDASGMNVTLMVNYQGEKGVQKGFFKPKSGEQADVPGGPMYAKEVASSEVATALGLEELLPAVAYRKLDKIGEGAFIEYMNGSMKNGLEFLDLDKYDKNDLTKMYDPFLNKLPSKTIGQAAALDYLEGNRDNHPKNWRSDGKKIGLIDRGNTYPPNAGHKLRSNLGAYAQRKKLKIKDAIGDTWDNKWDELSKIMKSHKIGSDSIALAKKRYDELIAAKDAGKGFHELESVMYDKVPVKLAKELDKKK